MRALLYGAPIGLLGGLIGLGEAAGSALPEPFASSLEPLWPPLSPAALGSAADPFFGQLAAN